MDLFLLLKAFLVGGIICAIGQVLIDYTIVFPGRLVFSICCSFHLSALKNT